MLSLKASAACCAVRPLQCQQQPAVAAVHNYTRRSTSSWSRRAALLLARAGDEPGPSTQTEAPSTSGSGDQPEELPIWVRREKEREAAAAAKGELPWPLYLLFSTFVAIASVGSVFEYVDRNAIFGVVQPDSPLWAPILGFFAFTGLPMAGLLFFKGVNAANEAAERQDKMDGYIK